MNKLKRTRMDRFLARFEVVRFLIAVLVAFLVSFLLLVFFTDQPVKALVDLLIGPLTSVRRLSTVIEAAIPLTFAGLAITVMFRSNQFNLAAEGGMYMGGLVAATTVIYLDVPPALSMFLALILAAIVGAMVTFIPGYLKVKWDTSVLVISLMLNTVILYLGTFLFNVYLRDPNSAYASSLVFRPGTELPVLITGTRLHAGLLIMIGAVILTAVFLNKTKWGNQITVTGSNLNFAKNAGIKTGGIILLAQIVGGLIAGVGGGVEMLGLYTRFQWMDLPGYGFDGVVLNIIAKDDPKLVPLAAFMVAYIRIGAEYMYRQSDVASEIVAIIEGIMIILIAAEGFLYKWRQRKTVEISTQELTAKEA